MVEILLREVEAFSMRVSLEAGPGHFQLYSVEFNLIYITPNAKEELSSHWFFNRKRLLYDSSAMASYLVATSIFDLHIYMLCVDYKSSAFIVMKIKKQ